VTLDLRALFGFSTDIELKDESEWERGPNIHQDRLNEPVRYAPAKVQWTKAEPTVPGLYAVRVDAQSPRRVVEVHWDGATLRGSWTDVAPFRVLGCGFEFSDHPLMEPE
jgi:hypothetical protein